MQISAQNATRLVGNIPTSNSSILKIDGNPKNKDRFSNTIFQGRVVSFREQVRNNWTNFRKQVEWLIALSDFETLVRQYKSPKHLSMLNVWSTEKNFHLEHPRRSQILLSVKISRKLGWVANLEQMLRKTISQTSSMDGKFTFTIQKFTKSR